MGTVPSAKIVLDSIGPGGYRLTTMEVVCHRFVLAEFNTHRVFSRNSASSRAIPVAKQIERVERDPALPLVWASEKPGMQGGEPLDKVAEYRAREQWKRVANEAVKTARSLTNSDRPQHNLHKSLVNRLLEPFMWHTIIVSATDWANFFGLRCNPMAQPEIQAVAYAMRDAYNNSEPAELDYGDWHLPYIQPDEFELELGDYQTDLRKVSAARCARVSYLTHDGVRDVSKDVELYERLVSATPQHSSPLEHVATPGKPILGNFTGWQQFRHLVIPVV